MPDTAQVGPAKEKIMESARLEDVPGLGSHSAAVLMRHGIADPESLARASLTAIISVPGFSSARAAKVREAAIGIVKAGETAPAGASEADRSEPGNTTRSRKRDSATKKIKKSKRKRKTVAKKKVKKKDAGKDKKKVVNKKKDAKKKKKVVKKKKDAKKKKKKAGKAKNKKK